MPDEGVVIRLRDDPGIVVARQRGRELAGSIGMGATAAIELATAISEIARNILTYARSGEVSVSVVRSGQRQGVEVVARDRGPGIADLELAMQDGYSTGGGLGLGLPGARRLMDDFEIRSAVGEGTTVTMRKWVR